jgi:hypothetical protein
VQFNVALSRPDADHALSTAVDRMMTDLIGICYASSATQLLSVDKLTALLVDAREFNRSVEVDVLLHRDGAFFPYFEGPAGGTAAVYARILKSRTHHSMIELLNQPTHERLFAHWLMGSSRVSSSTALSLRQAQ